MLSPAERLSTRNAHATAAWRRSTSFSVIGGRRDVIVRVQRE
jgi:hypothetical protein